ncbi:cysteine hydrolase family protein [Liquorilactobacillus mali]|uniref:Isochorismatase n=1 Tax=Liquorilactobacillus mali TaxID=1618 RepID=A0A0R2FJF6_9LACO|nr:isochorismatase family cysteine hydrolase [Liquorilactobacillus mali]KRN27819.1 isochorismatase [Liquorilactobacillus mali]
MKKALLIIDYTNDFVDDKGALTCGAPGQAIDTEIAKLADIFLVNHDYIIFPTDLHKKNDPYHPETKLFPPHNLANTWGRELFGSVGTWFDLHKNNDEVYFYDKNRYSSFANTNLENFLRTHQIEELYLTGVCTDICVLHTAIDAYNKNFKITIPQNAVASFNQIGHEWALDHFKNSLGATII